MRRRMVCRTGRIARLLPLGGSQELVEGAPKCALVYFENYAVHIDINIDSSLNILNRHLMFTAATIHTKIK
jgi:hypothetical protein